MAAASPSSSHLSGASGTPVSSYPPSMEYKQPPAFLKGFVPSKTAKADGEAPKRRGPKPDSKPAATKRQELNRLAQRTHRERKDLYAQELEQRVMQARDTYYAMVHEQEQLKHENYEMAQLLQANGIYYQSSYIRKQSMSQQSSFNSISPADSFSGASMSRTQTTDEAPFQASMSVPSSNGLMRPSPYNSGNPMGFPTPSQVDINFFEDGTQPSIGMAITTDHKISLDSIPLEEEPPIFTGGIFKDHSVATQFVATLERVCHEHKRLMCGRKKDPNSGELTGHALMLTSQPENHYLYDPEVLDNDHYHQLPDISDEAMLRMLLKSSKHLEIGIEVPPIVALQMIQAQERVLEITLNDFKELTNKLYKYMNCYGFGAVIPRYALHQELDDLFAKKDQERAFHLGLSTFNFNTPPTPYYREHQSSFYSQ
ncbi:MAG: hypothetical protein Q9225_003333 [Loekoesia sp. 1 TL-2023]